MRLKILKPFVRGAVIAMAVSGCGGAAGENEAAQGHDPHGGGGSFTEHSEGIELFVEYPHQIQGAESEEPWEIHLTWVDDWRPVEGASVTIEMHGPRGARHEIVAEPEIAGLYVTSPTLPSEGYWHAEYALSVGGRDYLVEGGEVEVFATEEEVHEHAGHTHAGDGADAHAGHGHDEVDDPHAGHDHPPDAEVDDAHAGHDHAEEEAHDPHAGHDHPADAEVDDAHAGHDHAQEDEIDDPHAGHDHPADAEVDDAHAGHDHALDGGPAAEVITLAKEEQWSIPFAVAAAEEREIPASIPSAGELVAPPGGLVHVSAPVAGLVQVDGPHVGPGDFVRAGQLLALIAPISLDNSFVRTRADVTAAQLEADRAERLFGEGAIPARRLEDARRNLQVATAAFEAIGGTADGVNDDLDPNLYRLRSPIDGVVAVRAAALGQQVEIGGHAFTIVNATTLWLVARVPARYAAEANRIRGAWFTVEGGTSSYTTSQVLSVGNMIDPASRTLPVRFAIGNSGGALKVGMLAEGHILLGQPVPGVAVPSAAIQDENNLPVVYVKLTGDTFERRVVETGPSDGSWTIVASGIDPGEHVVTLGAYQVNLAALGVVEPSDGHAH